MPRPLPQESHSSSFGKAGIGVPEKVAKGSPEASRATAPNLQMPESAFYTWTWYTTAARDSAGQQAAAGWYTDMMVNLTVLRGAQTVGKHSFCPGGYFCPGGCLRLERAEGGGGPRPGGCPWVR